MKQYLLDTSALLTLRDNEPGADRVAEILALAQSSEVRCFGCFITLMEVLYRVWRDEGERPGRLAYTQCLSIGCTRRRNCWSGLRPPRRSIGYPWLTLGLRPALSCLQQSWCIRTRNSKRCRWSRKDYRTNSQNHCYGLRKMLTYMFFVVGAAKQSVFGRVE